MSSTATATSPLLEKGTAVQRASKTHRVYASVDVERHNKPNDMWMTHNGLVYDVTQFAQDHPGGDDILLPWAGKDITEAMKDEDEHVHSKSAYMMMEEFVVGRIVKGDKIVSEDWEATEDFHPDDTDVLADYERCQFLDLSKPLLIQVWNSNFSKEYYLEQVHQPRHLNYSAQLFSYPFLEIFSVTPWYVVPTLWLPIAATMFYLSTVQFTPETADFSFKALVSCLRSATIPPLPSATSVVYTSLLWSVGCLLWTLLEYGFHRFVFHIDYYLPDHRAAIFLHFMMHGIHHFLPMDGLRLVMPPVLFFTLQLPFTTLAHALFPSPVAKGLISGAFTFYVLYDCMHYALHHTKLPAYLTKMKKYHLAHHYKDFDTGFGVTSKLWDYVFNTVLQL